MERNPLFKEKLSSDFSISHNITTSWSMSDYHFHDAFEIFYSLSEGIHYFIDDKVYELHIGDLLIFNNMDLHKSVAPKDVPYDRYVVTFTPEYVQDLSTPDTDLLECFLNRDKNFCCHIRLDDRQSESLLSLFKKAEFYRSAEDSIYGKDVYGKLVLAEILLLVNAFYRSDRSLRPTTPLLSPSQRNQYNYEKIKPVIQYILAHLNEDLSLDHLSDTFFISKYHLGYLFKKCTGFTVNEYIINRRVIKARELLRKGLPVSLTGEMVGFHNNSHFIRTFKKLVGTSPKQYAKNQGGNL